MRTGRWTSGLGLVLMLSTGLCVSLTIGCASKGQENQVRNDPGRVAPAGDLSTTISRSALRENAIAELLNATASENAQTRAQAIEALSISPSRLGPPLAAALRDENEGVRAVAATIAGKTSQRAQLGAVRSLVNDPSPFVQASAIFAARSLGDTSVDPTPLGALATGHPSARVRAHAASLLGQMGDESAIPLLRSVAASRIPRANEGEVRMLRLSASEAMVRLGVDEEIHTLLAALFPSTPDQLEAAAVVAQMLGDLGSRRAIPELTNLVVYIEPTTGQRLPAEVRMAAARSLGQLGKRDGAFVAMEYVNNPEPLIRAQAARVLGVMRGPEVLPTLQRMLDDPNPLVRVSAAYGALEFLEG